MRQPPQLLDDSVPWGWRRGTYRVQLQIDAFCQPQHLDFVLGESPDSRRFT